MRKSSAVQEPQPLVNHPFSRDDRAQYTTKQEQTDSLNAHMTYGLDRLSILQLLKMMREKLHFKQKCNEIKRRATLSVHILADSLFFLLTFFSNRSKKILSLSPSSTLPPITFSSQKTGMLLTNQASNRTQVNTSS